MRKPLWVIISAPSATGKDTLLDLVLDKFPNLRRTQSWTSKPHDGQNKYHHTTPEKFMAAVEAKCFKEYKENFGHLYGTYIADIPPGSDTISDMDPQAALEEKRKDPDVHTIFILPPDYLALERRHTKRGRDTEEQIKRRLSSASAEIALAEQFDSRIVNGEVTDAALELRTLLDLLQMRLPVPSSFRDLLVLQNVQANFQQAAQTS